MQRLLKGQVLFALILMVINSVYASQLLIMPPPFATGEPGPTFLPYLLCVFLYFAAARIIFTEFRDPSEKSGDGGSEIIPHITLVGPLVAIVLSGFFIIAFFYAGYLVSVACYTFLMALFFNYEQTGRWPGALARAALTSLVVTVFGWLFFTVLFELYLPAWEF